jgi:soluble cytochrome b562
MLNTTWWERGAAAMALALLAVPGLSACGDDAKADPATTVAETVEQYGVRIDAECPGDDPGFDPFMAEHPTPMAADWAEFLPSPRKMLADLRDCIAASHPPAAVAEEVDGVVAAFDVVIDDFDKALAAAKAGDLESTNKWITQMHDIDQPKIDEAISQVAVG